MQRVRHFRLISSLVLLAGWSITVFAAEYQEGPTPGIESPGTIPCRAPEHVPLPKLIHHVEPEYPASVRDKPTDAVVWLEIVVNEQGEVWHAKILEGSNDLLNQAALIAVRQWRYAATIWDGQAVPVAMRVPAYFGPTRDECGNDPPRTNPIRVGANALASKLQKSVEPEFPLGVGRPGFLILQVTLNEKGEVYRVLMLEGTPLLLEAAAKAVCQWQYDPTYLNGEPVAVSGTVVVPHRLPR